MVGQRLVQVVSEVPPQGEPVGHNLHQLPLGAQILEEKDQLELEKDHGINAGTASGSVEVLDQFPDEGEVEPLFQPAVKIVLRNELFEGDVVGE